MFKDDNNKESLKQNQSHVNNNTNNSAYSNKHNLQDKKIFGKLETHCFSMGPQNSISNVKIKVSTDSNNGIIKKIIISNFILNSKKEGF